MGVGIEQADPFFFKTDANDAVIYAGQCTGIIFGHVLVSDAGAIEVGH